MAYTYRNGRKIELSVAPDAFIARAQPEVLESVGIDHSRSVSARSSKVTALAEELPSLIKQAGTVARTLPAYQRAESGEDFLVTDRILLTLKKDAEPGTIDEIAGRYGLVVTQRYSDDEYLLQMTEHAGDPVDLVVQITENEGDRVKSVDHDLNQVMQTAAPSVTDPHYLRQWHLHARNPAADPRSSSHCEEAWALLGHGGNAEVVIGVTDDGCRIDHPDFNGPQKFAGWAYFVGPRLVRHIDVDADMADMYQPGANHGTSCAGVAAAEADGVLTVGAAFGCRLFPVKWESSGPSLFISDSKLRAVLDLVADKVDILSNSWGGAPHNEWSTQVRSRIAELARSGGRRGRGILFLWAAGNSNCPINLQSGVDIPFDNGWQTAASGVPVWRGVRTSRAFRNDLADVPGVMHVAALASTAQRSHYSNYGPGVDVTAPTNNVHLYRRLQVAGLGVVTASGEALLFTDRFGGTSSATPLVAGIAALVISANPELSAIEVAALLKRTASKDLDMSPYPRTPPAQFDPVTSWDVSPVAPHDRGDFVDIGAPEGRWSPWFGHGKVDAAAAVEAALTALAPTAVAMAKPTRQRSQRGRRSGSRQPAKVA